MAGEADSVVQKRLSPSRRWRRARSARSRSATRRLRSTNIDGTFYATDDECTHAAASLADGSAIDMT